MSPSNTILVDPTKTFPFESLRDVIETYWDSAAREYEDAPAEHHPFRKLQVLAEWLVKRNAPADGRKPIAEVIDNEDRGGVCPQCYRTDGHVDIGKSHWGVCNVHRVRWPIGYNLFSGWKYEPWAYQQEAWAQVAHYEVVKAGSCDELRTSACTAQECRDSGPEPAAQQV